ncbi:MAG TPA: CPBP family intramembrane glutamic endopeptidase [Acetobacteraceae bacterium]|jgi:membrane protease YdiL (CAAX protease family)
MDALAPNALLPAPQVNRARPEGPARLLFLALVWIAAASAASAASAFLIGVVVGAHNANHNLTHTWNVSPIYSILLMLVMADVVLVLAGWGRGEIVGDGDARAGLGLGPIRRPGLLLLFATVGEALIFAWAVLLFVLLKPAQTDVLSTLFKAAPTAGTVVQGVTLLCAVVLSPIWEEFFFRGWLWTGLRRYWGRLPVMFATAIPWLLLHSFDGLLRPLFLIPAAILLSLAREYCGGTRASLTLHVLNNLIAMVLVIFVAPLAHG